MHADDLFLNQCGKRKIIEQLIETRPSPDPVAFSLHGFYIYSIRYTLLGINEKEEEESGSAYHPFNAFNAKTKKCINISSFVVPTYQVNILRVLNLRTKRN